MHIETLSTDELGDRTYIAHDGQVAVVIDPQRDTDRVEKLLAEAGVTLGLVAETHIHNDYVTGGFQLARESGARYAVNEADPVTFDRFAVKDGDLLEVGTLRVQVMATPGHTFTHLAYVVTDTAAPDEPAAVFTGGSLLYGSVGRPDLLGPDNTEELARAQFRSVHRLADELADGTRIFPTHGFGSFCSTGAISGADASTIGIERRSNDALTAADEQRFVDQLVANLTAYPAYYAHMSPVNLQGPKAFDLSTPEQVDAAELARRIENGEWVVDLRDRAVYAEDHFGGTVSIALGKQFATYVGWILPWDVPLTLIGDSPEQISLAQRQLTRIGIDRLHGAATGDLDGLTAPGYQRRSYPRITFADLPEGGPDGVILDVRRDDERVARHIPGSVHIPLHELLARGHELPATPLFVHCVSGFRGSIAASLLERGGHEVTLIDDNFTHAVELGLTTA